MNGIKAYYKKTAALLLVFSLIMGFCSGCSGTSTVQEEPVETTIFTDSLGREVEVPEKIERYVVTGPLAQIILFALAPDEMVALANAWTDDAMEYLDEKYGDIPTLGQLYGGSEELNEEEIINTEAQVIIDVGEAKTDIQ